MSFENICFQCGKNPGMECPGRKPNECTRCSKCFELFMAQEELEQAKYYIQILQERLEQRYFDGYNKILGAYKTHNIRSLKSV